MFNNEESIAYKKMHDFSTVDGFVEINENLADMIKFVANEPSVGLYYIQQHTQNVTPNLLNLKNKVVEKSRETALHTEDLDDSMTMLRSMKECGIPVADEMLRDIKKSLSIISSKQQPKRGLAYSSSTGFLARTSSWSPASWGRNAVFDGERSPGYLSSAFKSVTQRANSFSRSQTGSEEAFQSKNEKGPSDFRAAAASTSGSSASATAVESEETLDSPLLDEDGRELQEESQLSKSLSHQHFLALYENYDEFKADREAKLEEWLGGERGEDQREGKKLVKGSLAQ